MKKQYKVLMLDMDGTIIPVSSHRGMPSERVLKALKAASEKIQIGVITARPYWFMEYIFDVLPLTAPCVVASAAEIIDPQTRKILKEQTISKEDTEFILTLLRKENLSANLDLHARKISVEPSTQVPDEPLDAIFFSDHLSEKKADELLKIILQRPTLAVHKMPTPEKGKFYISVNHAGATKHHGILQVAELLDIHTQEFIAVGDGHNDMPSLLASGLGVAMGNAHDDLKAIADYVAPSFDDDGVVDVIEKFIL